MIKFRKFEIFIVVGLSGFYGWYFYEWEGIFKVNIFGIFIYKDAVNLLISKEMGLLMCLNFVFEYVKIVGVLGFRLYWDMYGFYGIIFIEILILFRS